MTALVLPLALLLDFLFGEPPARFHPVCFMGRLAQQMEAYWRALATRTAAPTPAWRMFMGGMMAALCVIVPFVAGAYAIVAILGAWVGQLAQWSAVTVIVWLCLSPRSLAEHARAVAAALEEHSIPKAQQAVSMIVGRDVSQLDTHGVARAAVESVSENVTDGVLATLVWAAKGLSLGILLGNGAVWTVALVVLHRVTNTLDAMWGKRNERYAHFGTFAARLDDLINWLPARMALPCVAAAAWRLPKTNWQSALRVGWRDHASHASPNSAWSEAAFAGALGLRLGGPVHYGALNVNHPWFGDGTPNATAEHIRLSIVLMWRTTLIFTAILATGVALSNLWVL